MVKKGDLILIGIIAAVFLVSILFFRLFNMNAGKKIAVIIQDNKEVARISLDDSDKQERVRVPGKYHLEVLALQTVGIERTGEGVSLVTWDDRTYTILTNPVVLVEEKGMRWQYPFSAVALFDVVSNSGRVLLSCRLIGLGFDETKQIVLGWRGERP